MAEKAKKTTVLQQIVDPVSLTNLGYKEVEVSEDDGAAASLVKHVGTAGVDTSEGVKATLSGATIASTSSDARMKAANEEDERRAQENIDAEERRQREADERAAEQGIEPTVGQVKNEVKAKGRK